MTTADDLMRNAPNTADLYLRKAKESIDEQFGEGFAKANPALVGAFMTVSAMDFATCMGSHSLDFIGSAVQGLG